MKKAIILLCVLSIVIPVVGWSVYAYSLGSSSGLRHGNSVDAAQLRLRLYASAFFALVGVCVLAQIAFASAAWHFIKSVLIVTALVFLGWAAKWIFAIHF
jgi:hypothetical protein